MEQFINQMVEVIKSGVIMGGAYSLEDKDTALLYYYENGQFYLGNAVNGGPGVMDEVLTEAELRLRLEAHSNAISVEELERDKKEVAAMYKRILDERAIDVTAEIEDTNSVWFQEPNINISMDQAYALIHLLDDVREGCQYSEEIVDAIRSMYCQLPERMQKDIQELKLFTVIE